MPQEQPVNGEKSTNSVQLIVTVAALLVVVAYVSWQASAKYAEMAQLRTEHAAFKVKIDELTKENEKLKSQLRPTPIGTPIGNPAGSPTPLGSPR